jgi:hypothetical protein
MGLPVGRVVGAEQPGVAGLLATEPIWTELSAGIGLGEVVHHEPLQLASSTAGSESCADERKKEGAHSPSIFNL